MTPCLIAKIIVMAIKCIKKKEHCPFYFHTSSVRCKMKTVVILIRDVLKCDFYSQGRSCNDDVELVKKIGSLKSSLKTFIVC